MTRHTQKSRAVKRGNLAGMQLIRGDAFLMGSEDYYPEERPIRRASVADYWIDEHPVTNEQFGRFVEATGYMTFAEKAPDPRDYPGLLPELAKPGSAVFCPTSGPVDLRDPSQWWKFVIGADWRHPSGPGSSSAEIPDHPVVQIAYEDARAYAKWAGKELPTETEWEYAARGGLRDTPFAWGGELAPGGVQMANYWLGEFPWRRDADSRFLRTSPVRSFPANGYGLYDMIGNVWEWTADWFSEETAERDHPCCGPPRARVIHKSESYDPYAQTKIPRRVTKGGSHLCAENYCQRYRPAARSPQAVDSPTSHIGFRCVARM